VKIKTVRIVRPEHLDTAFSGKGALKFGGRWNSKGTAMVYCAGSRSLSALEMLVHLEAADILNTYLCIQAEFDDKIVLAVSAEDLPANWREDPIPMATMAIGDNWVASGVSAVLKVPSVIVPEEANYLLNPQHPDFRKVTVGQAKTL
jgi:RES domain-containing protein